MERGETRLDRYSVRGRREEVIYIYYGVAICVVETLRDYSFVGLSVCHPVLLSLLLSLDKNMNCEHPNI